MSKWTDPAEWARVCTPEGCVICQRGQPLSIVADLGSTWVTLGEEGAALPGACALFFKRHVVELHELTDDEAIAWMRDVRRLSSALQAVTGAVKLNYEVHGNTIPHLHMHFFPRYRGDPYENGPINPRNVPRLAYAPGEFEALKARLVAALEPR